LSGGGSPANASVSCGHAQAWRQGARLLPARPGRQHHEAVVVQGAQGCGLRDIADDVGDTAILGISPDKPTAQKKFDTKYGLGFPLLSDADHAVAEAYDVWTEKKNYGRTYMGILRSAFLVDEKGKVEQAWYKVSPKDTPKNLLQALGT